MTDARAEHDVSTAPSAVGGLVQHLFRREYGKLVVRLVRILGLERFDEAEELVQDTLLAAYQTWAYRGVPDKPEAWLMQVAKNKALNVLEHGRVQRRVHEQLTKESLPSATEPDPAIRCDIEDDMLRMMFVCCHPAIAVRDQLALLLKTLSGFGSREVARALLVGQDAVDKRLYRAKLKLRDEGMSLELPEGDELRSRFETVCTGLYLLFNEGYATTAGEDVIRRDLCEEAMRLCGLLCRRFPERPEAFALMALMCFHTARFEGRVDSAGSIVLLQDQDRKNWDRRMIAEGLRFLSEAARGDTLTAYHLEASIAAQHCVAASMEETDWSFIESLYGRLREVRATPIVDLNLAIVKAQLGDLDGAIHRAEALRGDRRLERYAPFHVALGDLYARDGRVDAARTSFERAAELAVSPRQTAFITARLECLG